MKIALISHQENKVAEEEISLLRSNFSKKHEAVDVRSEEDISLEFDAALMRIPDYKDTSLAEELAWKIWDMGIPFLIDPPSRRLARNKLYTHRLFAERGIRQPAWSMNPADLAGEIIQKPLCGGKSMDVTWHKESPSQKPEKLFLFQEYRKPRALWRSIASPRGILLAYKKISKEKIISISSGAEREILPPSPELETISRKITLALGGGLWGLDIIEDEEGLWALEANMNFGYPLEYAAKISKEITLLLEEKTAA